MSGQSSDVALVVLGVVTEPNLQMHKQLEGQSRETDRGHLAVRWLHSQFV